VWVFVFPSVLFVCLVLFVFSCVMAVDGTCWSSTESLLILSFATYSHQEVCVYAVIKEFVKMQRTPQCVERPGGSQEAWDGKKTWLGRHPWYRYRVHLRVHRLDALVYPISDEVCPVILFCSDC
jgi:hypothetical protein